MGMTKDEYRVKVLNELEVIKLNTEMTSIFSLVADTLLFFIMILLLFK